ncbi:mitochondrial import receptor subunit TOM6 homolog [Echinops telfairi]|uniref:Mitochondrial import receptor subunit TOM6 homolog n=2 Tax=Echinops telfairi TaxID=9371 RepID=A0ABM0IYH3_ECHTE|nr:mitochondrial import receptor subunit TOM6 homolog [Echinops telfairi]XP_045150765.1 mitochondrial import receptor subunit TOM6 homolog [Echinops telfairi]
MARTPSAPKCAPLTGQPPSLLRAGKPLLPALSSSANKAISQRPRVTVTGRRPWREGGGPGAGPATAGPLASRAGVRRHPERGRSTPYRRAEVRDRKCVIHWRPRRASREPAAELEGAAMASTGVGASAAGSANETPEIPDNVGDWLRGVYRFATDRNDFRRNLILNLGLFAAGVWLARNLSDIDLMAPQPGV